LWNGDLLSLDFIQNHTGSAANFQYSPSVWQAKARKKILAQAARPGGLLLEARAPVNCC
jgi:hypothetical protein